EPVAARLTAGRASRAWARSPARRFPRSRTWAPPCARLRYRGARAAPGAPGTRGGMPRSRSSRYVSGRSSARRFPNPPPCRRRDRSLETCFLLGIGHPAEDEMSEEERGDSVTSVTRLRLRGHLAEG